nr:ATP-binding cassette domain-containing protein [Salicibibacter halophilus]
MGVPKKKRVRELLDVVGLGEHGQKYPHECSGGMLSRAALARALFTNPRLLLMDEPFSGLDAITKEQLQLELTKVVESYDVAVVFITHDIQEAVFLADRVLLLSDEAEIKEYSVPFQRQREKPLKFTSAFTEIVKKIHRGLDQGASA